MSVRLVKTILEQLSDNYVKHIIVCAGSRNALFIQELGTDPRFDVSSWPEERSGAFYALGLIKQQNQPVAIVTTSGTAVGELLPATMEAFYTGLPLVLITADRPKRFRGSGAPQTADQVGIFSHYIHDAYDLDESDTFAIKINGTCHINVCLEDPKGNAKGNEGNELKASQCTLTEAGAILERAEYPLVIVSCLAENERAVVKNFIMQFNVPVYLESTSGLREDKDLQLLSILYMEKIWERQRIDTVIRIGGVPTTRIWRDLDDKEGEIQLLSITSQPLPGTYWGKYLYGSLQELLPQINIKPHLPQIREEAISLSFNNAPKLYNESSSGLCVEEDTVKALAQTELQLWQKRCFLFEQFPRSEPGLIHSLSRLIPQDETVYLGNSLPIREWDMAACYEHSHANVYANRGVNGIDGQLSTFLGLCRPTKRAWGIFGDLTTLYDLAAPWVLAQKQDIKPVFIIVNNGGGMIFSRMYKEELFLNRHRVNFEYFAKLWNMHYLRWYEIPNQDTFSLDAIKTPLVIEIIPSEQETIQFWQHDASLIKT